VHKNLLCIAVLVSTFSNAQAFDEFGKVKFKMTRKQVESKGYACTASPLDIGEVVCRNFDLRNSAYGYMASNYMVILGTDKKVYQISADILGIRRTEDYLDLVQKVTFMFPIEDEANSTSVQGAFVRYARRDASNVGALVVMAAGASGVRAMNFSISYTSPDRMVALDKKRRTDKSKEEKPTIPESPLSN
jgi:hypothetical protein